MSDILINIFGWRGKKLTRLDPIVFNYRQLLAYIRTENDAAPVLDEIIANLIHILGFYYEQTWLEENPETARFTCEFTPIAECWARVEGYEECLHDLIGKIPPQLGGTTYRRIMKEMFIKEEDMS
jgi:hypothetical protein